MTIFVRKDEMKLIEVLGINNSVVTGRKIIEHKIHKGNDTKTIDTKKIATEVIKANTECSTEVDNTYVRRAQAFAKIINSYIEAAE